jgi:L-alanine-DL-glutamate epimerase-like enolase superfamily enzyme
VKPSAHRTHLHNLRAKLEALALHVDSLDVHHTAVVLEDYPDGPRPTSTVAIRGAELTGYGEHVGWTEAEHETFRENAHRTARGATTLGAWSRGLSALPPYDRAALEAAALDLALRQSRTTLFEIAGVPPTLVRYVVSFVPGDDPAAHARTAAGGDLELKIDADPDWTVPTWRSIATAARIAVIDFKLRGETDDHERACETVEGAWIEDPKPGEAPWSPTLLSRLSVDAAVTSTAALASLLPVPAAVNVKTPRMGGVLEAISCLAACESRGLHAYIGGMFEVGIGRRQSLVLAAIACPDGPNDIAPLAGAAPRPPRLEVPVPIAGFAGDPE